MFETWVGDKGAQYADFVARAASDARVFSTFRRQSIYKSIVETLDGQEGKQFLDVIADERVRQICLASEAADRIGAPHTFRYEGAMLAPTTLRYGKVLCDLLSAFPHFLKLKSMAEIGIGYGGQARIISEYCAAMPGELETYTCIDLAPVLELARRYLDNFHLLPQMRFCTRIEIPQQSRFDLAISNYAFSELDRTLQENYLRGVLLKSRSGYLTMNTGLWNGEAFGHACMRVEELLETLPNAVLMADEPASATSNYIIIFGEHEAAGMPLAEIRQRSEELIAARQAKRAARKSLKGIIKRVAMPHLQRS
jgi:putative sugar O-methyltransferase